MPYLRITQRTWDRLTATNQGRPMVGTTMLPDVYVSNEVKERVDEFRQPGEDDDTALNRALDYYAEHTNE